MKYEIWLQPQSKRLTKPNMNRPAWLAQEGAGGSGEGGRVDQESVIDPQRSERRVESHSDADCVCHVAESEIADALEDIAEVVERHEPQPAGQWIAQFEVEDAQRVASERKQRRQYARFARLRRRVVATVRRPRHRFDDGLRARSFESESAQRRRAA